MTSSLNREHGKIQHRKIYCFFNSISVVRVVILGFWSHTLHRDPLRYRPNLNEKVGAEWKLKITVHLGSPEISLVFYSAFSHYSAPLSH